MCEGMFKSALPAFVALQEFEWIGYPELRDKDVAAVLEQDAAARERENKSPRAEVQLLKHSGLLKILGWAKYGGGEQPWSVAYRAIREVAKADG